MRSLEDVERMEYKPSYERVLEGLFEEIKEKH